MAKVDFIFENEQDKLPFTEELEAVIRKAVETTLDTLEWEDVPVQVSVTITDNEKIREINSIYRKIDSETDVLSFPIIEFSPEGEALVNEGDYDGDTLLLGDIMLSLEKALAQSEEYGHSFVREVGFLSLHSALHLMGFDNIDEKDAVLMRKFEDEIAEKMDLRR
ncbi:MAG: rRNA maturation RNase YbeY [Clostridia bacterium]|nr:rRNA maturation RNase YbeY [Clostridia bacterium]